MKNFLYWLLYILTGVNPSRKEKEVVFHNLGGVNVPLQPWPQSFYISPPRLYSDENIELRPLTVTGLVKGIGKNFICMNLWRLQHLLWRCGFMCTEEGGRLAWRDLRLNFMKVLRERGRTD